VSATTAAAGIAPLVIVYRAWIDGNFLLSILVLLLSISNIVLTYFAFRKDVRSWGGIFLADVFLILIMLPLAQWVMLGLAVASLACIVIFRLEYGVGAYRLEVAKEDTARAELEKVSTRNPTGARCRTCGQTKLWIASDGSAVCMSCNTGMTRAVGAFPRAASTPPPPPP